MKISYEDNVFEELLAISSYLFDIEENLAQRFLDSCDDTFKLIATNPLIGAPNKFDSPKLSLVRMFRVKDFDNYLLFYVPIETGIRIIHVIHSAVDYNRIFSDEQS
ncbi:MAG: type II toxin-antitoxin system RelE/ParE family toxin [Acidobacteria bacterium]|nr:type II toxin-antitoxin system RelE/ParE family toxin [Acidobacteriota bacterium]